MKTIYSKATSEFCKLCLMEKLYILNALGDERCLNKRTEFISKCRHQNKLLLKNVKYTLLGLNFAGIKFRGWLYSADSLLSNFSRISRMGISNL